jgi:hypothetical protein
MAMQDDLLSGAVPDPETEPTPAELAQARRFAELVDKALSGRTPPAMSADDRALLEVAGVIRASQGHAALGSDRQRILVEDALRQAIGLRPAQPAASGAGAARAQARPSRQRGPWIAAGASALVAAAAIGLLWLRAPRRAALPAEWTSRPADALIGPIAREHAGDASARIDAIFADRLDGFRARRLARSAAP